jgi:hypothetical protein
VLVTALYKGFISDWKPVLVSQKSILVFLVS